MFHKVTQPLQSGMQMRNARESLKVGIFSSCCRETPIRTGSMAVNSPKSLRMEAFATRGETSEPLLPSSHRLMESIVVVLWHNVILNFCELLVAVARRPVLRLLKADSFFG